MVHGLTTGILVELVVPDEMAADIRLITFSVHPLFGTDSDQNRIT